VRGQIPRAGKSIGAPGRTAAGPNQMQGLSGRVTSESEYEDGTDRHAEQHVARFCSMLQAMESDEHE
jgi:hypothetical protein